MGKRGGDKRKKKGKEQSDNNDGSFCQGESIVEKFTG